MAVPSLRDYPVRLLVTWVLIATVVCFYYGFVHDVVKRESVARDLALQARPILKSDARIFAVGSNLSILEFYFHRPVEEVRDLNVAWRRARPPDGVFLIAKKERGKPDAVLPAEPRLRLESARSLCVLMIKPEVSERGKSTP